MLKHTLTIVIFCLVGLNQTSAQAIEIGLQGGVSNYWGDLSPTPALNESRYTGGIFARLNLNNTWAWNNQFNFTQISGNDKNFEVNKFRNLSFRTDIVEFSSVMEFNFIKYGPYVLDKKFSPYLYAGISAIRFNPKALLDGEWLELSGYRTEGFAYDRTTFAIPFGMGVKWMPNNRFALEGQIGARRTFTDYLDDVSTVYPDMAAAIANGRKTAILTDRSIENSGGIAVNKSGYKRGNADYKDWFFTATISLAVRINTKVKCARFY